PTRRSSDLRVEGASIAQGADRVVALPQQRLGGERAIQPTTQLPRAHGGDAAVDHREKGRVLAAAQGSVQLEIAAARGIEDQRFAPLLDVQRTDVRQRRFLRVAHVLQQRSGSCDRERQLVGTEALQVERAELVGEEARGARELEVPGRSRAQRSPGAREGLIAGAFGEQQLRGLQPLELRGERLSPLALEHREAAGGEIEPGEPEAPSIARRRGNEGVPALLEQRGFGHGSRRDDTHHRPLDRTPGSGRVGQLLADRDALALAHQPPEIGVHGVIRHARHRDRLAGRLAARGERDVEERSGPAGVVVEQLVEIAHAVEEQHVRVLTLDAQVLLHHRRMLRADRVVHGREGYRKRTARVRSRPRDRTATGTLPGGLASPYDERPELYVLAERVGEKLKAAGRRLVTAESCTAGWVAKALTDVPGSSQWFECGYVTDRK